VALQSIVIIGTVTVTIIRRVRISSIIIRIVPSVIRVAPGAPVVVGPQPGAPPPARTPATSPATSPAIPVAAITPVAAIAPVTIAPVTIAPVTIASVTIAPVTAVMTTAMTPVAAAMTPVAASASGCITGIYCKHQGGNYHQDHRKDLK
jgi:hypothetical protein